MSLVNKAKENSWIILNVKREFKLKTLILHKEVTSKDSFQYSPSGNGYDKHLLKGGKK